MIKLGLNKGVYGLVCVGSLFASATIVSAASYTVPKDASSIQAAIDKAANGDTIIVKPGIYYENITINDKFLTLKSQSGSTSTIIDGRNLAPAIKATYSNVSNDGFTVDGFTLQNGNGTGNYGGAVSVDANGYFYAAINNCVVSHNTSTDYAGGIGVRAIPYGNTSINNSSFNNNSGGNGGAIAALGFNSNIGINNSNLNNNSAIGSGGALYGGGGVYVTNSIISGNKATNGGAAAMSAGSVFGSLSIVGSLVDMNSATESGGAVWVSSWGPYGRHAVFTQSTITNNSAPVGGSITQLGEAQVVGVGNIIFGNSTPPSFVNAAAVNMTYSIIDGGFDGIGNINADPLFVNAPSRDYQLQPGSPAIDMGINTNPGGQNVDLLGNSRPATSGWDMGAYEYIAPDTTAPVSAATVAGTSGNINYNSDVTFSIASTDNTAVKEIHYTVNGVETVVPGATATFTLSSDGYYDIAWYAIDEAGNVEAPNTTSFSIDKTAPVVSSTSPVKGATGVSTSSSTVITFSENIVQGSTYANITLKKGTTTVSSIKTISGNKLTIKPSSTMSSATTYTVTLPASAVKDANGNNTSAYTMTFKTK